MNTPMKPGSEEEFQALVKAFTEKVVALGIPIVKVQSQLVAPHPLCPCADCRQAQARVVEEREDLAFSA